jgi:MFS transporter, PAT family, beta-lactamase induction signal transducer AmpG
VKTFDKLALLGSLYLAQGLPFGFFTNALPVLMRQRGLELSQISLTYLLALPWALKFLWAPYVDRWGSARLGRRRSWILPLQTTAVVIALVLAYTDPAAGLTAMMVALFLSNLTAATQDIATDGLAVDTLSPEERGHGNGVQVAAYRMGMILGGGLLLGVYGRYGWRATYFAMAGLLALSSLPVLLHRERPALSAPATPRPSKVSWRAVARRPKMAAWLLVLVLYKGGEALGYGVVKPFFIDQGLTTDDVAWIIGTVGFLAGLAGAVIGGWAVSRFGRGRALAIAGVLQIVGIAAYIAPALGYGGREAILVVSALEHLTAGIATVTLFTIMMDVCGEAAAATEYTLQASGVVIATGVAAIASGFLAQRLSQALDVDVTGAALARGFMTRRPGYAAHFGASAALSALGLAYTMWAWVTKKVPPERPAAAAEP